MIPLAHVPRCWRAKLAWTLALNGSFFTAYALVQRHHLGAPTTMPLLPGEASLPFWPAAVWPYLSLALFMPCALWAQPDARALRRHVAALTLVGVAGLACFALLPTRLDRPPLPADAPAALVWLRAVDGDGNACPSLHAAFATLTAVGCSGRLAAWTWWAAILAGIVLVRQHTVLDVLAGTLLGAVGAWWWRRGAGA